VIISVKFRPSVLQSLTIIILFLSLNKKGMLTPKREPVMYSIVFIVNSRLFLLTPFISYSLIVLIYLPFLCSLLLVVYAQPADISCVCIDSNKALKDSKKS
jgi:hypothetical protein